MVNDFYAEHHKPVSLETSGRQKVIDLHVKKKLSILFNYMKWFYS